MTIRNIMKMKESSKNGAGERRKTRKTRRKRKMVKEGEGRMLLGNRDEMLMCLLLMHCSKVREEGVVEKEGRKDRGQAG